MKKCPFCSEEIQEEAKKCRFCGEWLEKASENKTEEVQEKESKKEDIERKKSTFLTLEEIKKENKNISYYIFARLGAKYVDIAVIFFITLIIGIIFFPKEIMKMSTGMSVFLFWIFYVIYDTIAISQFKSTLGKYLFEIKIYDKEGKNLDIHEAFIRAVRVLVLGLGLGVPLLTFIAYLFQWVEIKLKESHYNTSYDKDNYIIKYETQSPPYKLGIGIAIIVIYFLWSISG